MSGVRGLDSVVFATANLEGVREFYRGVLGLQVGTFKKDGRAVPDESDVYVNFAFGEVLLGFERGPTAETGTLVLKVDDLEDFLGRLAERGVRPERRKEGWAVLRDPEGREVILQK